MPKVLEEVTRDALDLPLDQRLALAESLLESADTIRDSDAETAWNFEIRTRISAIDEGRVTGISYEQVMQAAEQRLAP